MYPGVEWQTVPVFATTKKTVDLRGVTCGQHDVPCRYTVACFLRPDQFLQNYLKMGKH